MVSRRDRPLQTWKTFLCNHMEGIASIDLFVVPTIALSNCSRFLFSAIDGERVLADIDSDHGNGSVEFLRHGVLLVFGAPCWLRLLEHGRTIPLADLIASRPPSGLPPLLCRQWLPRYIVLHRTPEMDCARTSHDREAALSTRSDQAITLR
jgi:hypothetical protein